MRPWPVQSVPRLPAVLLVLNLLPVLQNAAPGPALAPGNEPRLDTIQIEPLRTGSNLLSNASFEETGPNGVPVGWQWDRRNTDGVCMTDRQQAHWGSKALFITNGTAFGAHVYGTLWCTRPLRLDEGKPYTLSAWVRSEAPGQASLLGGADWQFRVSVRPTGGQWRRIWKTFTPGPRDRDFVLRINTESPTPGVWFDDVKIEAGTTPSPDLPAGGEVVPAWMEWDKEESVVQGDGPFGLSCVLYAPQALAGVMVADLGAAPPLRRPVQVERGFWRLQVQGEAIGVHDTPRTFTLRLEQEGREIARAQAGVRFCSVSNALRRLEAIRAALPQFQSRLETLRNRGQDIAYPRTTLTVLENFPGYAEEDARRNEVGRALEQIADMESMIPRLDAETKVALEGGHPLPPVPRWTGDRRPMIRGNSFLGPTRAPGGGVTDRPIFFNGYGHFRQVVNDMEKWPGYGANMIQIEFGPSSVFPAENRTNSAPMIEMRRTLDRASQAGVAVCLLISPHYLPRWALDKWPHLRKRREGFLQYCLHAPEGRELLRRFVAVALAPLKDHPALHSVCLSNEPVDQEEYCEEGAREWRSWLAARHGDIASLNAVCGSNFASFAEVPLPDPFGRRPATALWMDYVRFNQEFFAGWHKMLANAVHQAAPGLPVHAKTMTWTLLNDGDVKYGVEATLFGGLSDINGNDSVNFYSFGQGEFAQGWLLNAMSHDLQRSVRDAPVFNTENHLIEDRNTRRVPPEHIRAALWQAAVHGQGATAIWVWERTFDPKSDFAGSIMHRPACAEAVGRVNLDLNRAALEVTALQQAPPQVLLLQSTTAAVWDGGASTDCLGKLYTALAFLGLKTGFVTERQLEQGMTPVAPLVFVPAARHLSAAALAGLRRYEGRLVLVGGDDLLRRDEYDRERGPAPAGDRLPYRHGPTTWRDLHRELMARLPQWGVHPGLELRDPAGGPAWGVVWRTAETAQGRVVNLCNERQTPVVVALHGVGGSMLAEDVLDGTRLDGPMTLQPLEVRLVRLVRR